MPDEARIRTDGGANEDNDREVADLELRDGDWLHDGEDDEDTTREPSTEEETLRDDELERSEHVEEMAIDIATDLLHEHVDGFNEEDASDRSEEVVNEYADDHGIDRWDEYDLDEFEIWARENLR